MKYLRWLLFPFALIYGLIVVIRNWCYDAGLFSSRQFDIPVIAVGNLEVGGAGKSPMTEYLIRLLKADHKLATLSRGYGRDTKGFVLADENSTATQIGDEPAQFKRKFPDVTVAVCEKRVIGIEHLLPEHDLVILDDAYQHRAVKPGFSILLFDFNNLVNNARLMLPAGNYREPFSGRWRADVIVISKCPAGLSTEQQQSIARTIAPLPYQELFFTSISYFPLQKMIGNLSDVIIDADTTVFLLSGIANPVPLVDHIKKQTPNVIHHNYPDHHRFSLKNITKLADEFAAHPSEKKLIITTEKDAQRLGEHELLNIVKTLPILVLPIGISFLNNGQQQFDKIVQQYVREHRAHS